ncbi:MULTISPECIES: hypothetical protein [unclassified Herbaspirillum]|uniref:hypothetical protein n=1 Tax=unclassified Herbaspirillum TaxID=2624150 RepID=UPI001154C944|nr:MULTISPECIES: hypothetical protein [unclassified Herbaspirillum]MBB5393816.1 hypothetical protein [Herbaspirillum sp. SJZ102]
MNMQPEYLARLNEPVQQFVLDVEEGAGVEINVILDSKQNEGGTTGQGKLAVVIDAKSIQLFAPTNGYFPDGAVRHEVLHVRRFHVEGVPKLALADSEEWDKGFSDALGALDNAIEHIIIVPEELQFHSDRRKHWETVMQRVCSELPHVPEGERCLAVCLHWTFLRHVLPDSPVVEIARSFANKHALLELADHFADRFKAVAASKEKLVHLLFHTFPEIPKNRVALEYINSVTGTCQKPIP